jgi:hypothetical protein
MRWVAGVVALLGVSACRHAEDRATERVVEKMIAAQGRESSVEVDHGRGSIVVNLGPAIVPANWPSDVPVYPNASRLKAEERGDQARRLSVTTTDSVKPLAQFYRAKLPELGWRLQPGTGDSSVRARKDAAELSADFSARSDMLGSRAVFDYRISRGESKSHGG